MKISNIIVITFFTLIVGVILAMFIYGRVGKDHETVRTSKPTEFPIPAYSVIIADQGVRVDVHQDNQGLFKVYNFENDVLSENPDDYFRVSNDTLYVLYKDKQCRVSLKSDSLSVIIVGSRVDVRTATLKELKILAKESTVNAHDVRCNGKLHIMLDKSKLDYYSGSIRQLSIQLQNESRSDFHRRPDILQLEKDTSSDFRFY